jgi:archaeal type IV pilus assembly protein PilA
MGKKGAFGNSETAVSPVVGVMLMLVVTIIIAAVVSAYAGGMASGQKKIPQATIQADYSIKDGMTIQHAGGDPLPTADIQFIIWDGPTFGPNIEQSTKQALNMSTLRDESGLSVKSSSGAFNTTALLSGSTLTINATDCACKILQPNIVPTDFDDYNSGGSYTGTQTARWGLCLSNPNNVGKEFMLSVSDKNGNLIARTNVKVTV